jgi:hypothetical protein
MSTNDDSLDRSRRVSRPIRWDSRRLRLVVAYLRSHDRLAPASQVEGRGNSDALNAVNNTPISHAVELGAERIYVLPTYAGWQRLRPVPRGALDAAVHGLSLLIDGRLKVDIARYGDEVELIVLLAPNPLQVQPSEFGYASRLMRDALTASRELLARGDPVVSTRRRAAARQPEPASGESRTAITVALHDIAAG